MDNNTIKVKAILLTGKEAITIPCLAFIGGASIVGIVGLKLFKLCRKHANIKSKKEDELIQSIKEFIKSQKEF